jgi:HEAT repeat protein
MGLFASDENDVRTAAAYALGEIGDRRAVPALTAALNDQKPDVRFNSAIALARFGEGSAIGVVREMLDRSRLDQVAGMRPDQKEDVMLAAIPALMKLAPEEAPAILGPLAERDASLRVRSAAKEALAKRRP